MQRIASERLLMIGAVILPVVLLLNAALWLYDIRTLTQNDDRVIHSYRVISTLDNLLALVQDAESAQRGYILTGSQAYLEPYHEALPQVSGTALRLDTLTTDSPLQNDRVAVLIGHINQRLDIMDATLTLRDLQGIEVARDALLSGAGKREMDALRLVFATIRAEEDTRLRERVRSSAAAAERTRITLVIATLISLMLAGTVIFLLRRALQARRETELQLSTRRDELESLVSERTAALELANVELREEVATRTAAEERLRNFAAELGRSNRELEDFAFIASHDLQEPLRKIQAFGERLDRRYGDTIPEEGRDDLRRVQAASLRMRSLVNDLLSYARVARQGPNYGAVDLSGTIRETADELSRNLSEVDARVEVQELPTISADRALVKQVFHNLFSNAFKFRQEGVAPEIRIWLVEHTNEVVTVGFSDNGIGFDQKYADRIFGPFERLHPPGRYEGTGIGLAVCRRILERHGGHISVKSAPNEGATFYVTFPLSPTARPILDEPPKSPDDDTYGG
ncbi:CHASE3 domain-containing protein [soil metagenome]